MSTIAPGPSATLRVGRLMAISLGLGGIILFALDFPLVAGQTHRIAAWWSVIAIAGVLGASIAVAVVGAFGTWRATSITFIVLAGAVLVPSVLAPLASPQGDLPQQLWIVDLAVIGAAAAGAGLPVPAAIGYLAVLMGSFALEVAVALVPDVREVTHVHLLTTLFYISLFTALAAASSRAGRMLDDVVRSAVSEATAAAEAEARRAQRRRVEELIHDTLIVALLAFGRGDRAQDARAAREATRALSAIEALEASRPELEAPTARAFAWRLQALTTELEPEIRFDYEAAEDATVPPVVAGAVAEAMSEAIRNSLRHAGPVDRVARQVTVEVGVDGLRVVVLDDGVGFEQGTIASTRLGIREGIVHRMALIGGRGQALSRSGRGTTVLLEWSAS
jgi:two-component sensor histidine kinase